MPHNDIEPIAYRWIDAAQLRLATRAASAESISGPIFSNPPEVAGIGTDWVRRAWTEWTSMAVRTASPSLADGVEGVLAGDEDRPKRVRKVAESLHRYLLRAHGRATPFGLFAGVAPVRFGAATAVTAVPDRIAVDADAGWLSALADVLEADPAVLQRLPVMVNDLVFPRGSRLVVPYSPAGQEERPLIETSVRLTSAVESAVAAARRPIEFADLVEKVAAEFPDRSRSVIGAFMRSLVESRVLVTALRTAKEGASMLDSMLVVLADSGIDSAPANLGAIRALQDMQARLAGFDGSPRGFAGLQEDCRIGVKSGYSRSPIAVQARAGVDVVLPESVAAEAAAAAEALLRLSPYPHGLPTWAGWHDRFLELFGVGVPVPIIDAIGPAGVGFPAGYADAQRPQVEGSVRRDAWLLSRVHESLSGAGTIVVTDDDLAELTPNSPVNLPAHIELLARVEAADVDAIDRGDFRLVVSSAPRAAGSVTARFTSLLGGHGARGLSRLPVDIASAVPAQLSVTPLYPRAGNVAPSVRLLPLSIRLGQFSEPADDIADVADLAVVADWTRLYLVSRSRQRVLEPTALHSLNFLTQVPPIARFLCELPRAHQAVFSTFSFGSARSLVRLPRVVYRRTVLSPETWQLSGSDLAADDWPGAFSAWRDRWQVPDQVCLKEEDRVLRLDLADPSHLAVLKAKLSKSSRVVLTEAPPRDADGWIGGRANEVAFPLARVSPPGPAPSIDWTRPSTDVRQMDRPPEWCSLKVTASELVQDEILRHYLPRLLEKWGSTPGWWYIRFRDHIGPQLRLRVEAKDGYGRAVELVEAWVRQLSKVKLIVDWSFSPYRPETARYGSGPALAQAENVFMTDSVAARAQVDAVEDRAVPASTEALTAASLVDMACAFSSSRAEGMQQLIALTADIPRATVNRADAEAAIRLADVGSLSGTPSGPGLAAAWGARHDALRQYRLALWNSPQIRDEVLTSLLHMHHNRVVGPDRANETTCLRIARAVAHSFLSRNSEVAL